MRTVAGSSTVTPASRAPLDAAAVLHLLGRREVPARIDAPGLAPVLGFDGLDFSPGASQDLDGVRQVVLPADRVLADA